MYRDDTQSSCEEGRQYYWSPSVRWEKRGSELRIEQFSYPEPLAKLFPDLYYAAQRGIVLDDLPAKFPGLDRRELEGFLADLIRNRILVNSVLTPGELFFPISILTQRQFNPRLAHDMEEMARFKAGQLNRSCPAAGGVKTALKEGPPYPPLIADRVSWRDFDSETPIDFASVSRLLGILGQRRIGDRIQYYYASAGGLYPIDVFVYAKPGRVEGIEGLHYFSPVDNSLTLVDGQCRITREAHYPPNQAIFQNSALSIYLIFNASVTAPKYGGIAYFYACIDAGLMVGALTLAAEMVDMGVCSIGDMKFRTIDRFFRLNRDHVYLHSVECGRKPRNTAQAPAPAPGNHNSQDAYPERQHP